MGRPRVPGRRRASLARRARAGAGPEPRVRRREAARHDRSRRRLPRWKRAVESLDAPVVAALRLGLFEVLFSEGADHAAVDGAVELAKGGMKRGGPRRAAGAGGLVNAVLRRAAREREARARARSRTRPPRDAAMAHSVPEWLAEMWWEELGRRGRAIAPASDQRAAGDRDASEHAEGGPGRAARGARSRRRTTLGARHPVPGLLIARGARLGWAAGRGRARRACGWPDVRAEPRRPGGRRGARPRAGGEGARPLRGPGREDGRDRGARRARRARSSPSRRTRGARGRSRSCARGRGL